MYIDFHTHAFPTKIAASTLSHLREGSLRVSGCDILPHTDGTYEGLESVCSVCGVDLAVVLPIVTKPSQTQKVNAVASEINNTHGRLLSFGSLHPLDLEAEDIVDRLAEDGFVGIKLHPEFQGVYADSDEMVRVCKRAERTGLTVVLHAGRDIGYPPPVHADPERLCRIVDACPSLTLVAAHLGGWMMWDEVADRLVGTPIYFDTAFISDYLSTERARDIIRAHGSKRVLFGSDCPWELPGTTIDYIKKLSLTKEEEDNIFFKNAKIILNRER